MVDLWPLASAFLSWGSGQSSSQWLLEECVYVLEGVPPLQQSEHSVITVWEQQIIRKSDGQFDFFTLVLIWVTEEDRLVHIIKLYRQIFFCFWNIFIHICRNYVRKNSKAAILACDSRVMTTFLVIGQWCSSFKEHELNWSGACHYL